MWTEICMHPRSIQPKWHPVSVAFQCHLLELRMKQHGQTWLVEQSGFSPDSVLVKNLLKTFLKLGFYQLPIKGFRTEKSFSENVPEAGSSTGLFATFAAFCSVSSNDLVWAAFSPGSGGAFGGTVRWEISGRWPALTFLMTSSYCFRCLPNLLALDPFPSLMAFCSDSKNTNRRCSRPSKRVLGGAFGCVEGTAGCVGVSASCPRCFCGFGEVSGFGICFTGSNFDGFGGTSNSKLASSIAACIRFIVEKQWMAVALSFSFLADNAIALYSPQRVCIRLILNSLSAANARWTSPASTVWVGSWLGSVDEIDSFTRAGIGGGVFWFEFVAWGSNSGSGSAGGLLGGGFNPIPAGGLGKEFQITTLKM